MAENKFGIDVVDNLFALTVQVVDTTKNVNQMPKDAGFQRYLAYTTVIPGLIELVSDGNIKRLPDQLGDLENDEIEILKAKYGSKINDARYLSLFGNLARVANDLVEIF